MVIIVHNFFHKPKEPIEDDGEEFMGDERNLAEVPHGPVNYPPSGFKQRLKWWNELQKKSYQKSIDSNFS